MRLVPVVLVVFLAAIPVVAEESQEVIIEEVEFLRQVESDLRGEVGVREAPQMEKLKKVVPDEEVLFRFKTNLLPGEVSLLLSNARDSSSDLFGPYYHEPSEDGNYHTLYFGLGKYDEGDEVVISVVKSVVLLPDVPSSGPVTTEDVEKLLESVSKEETIVYRTGFRIPERSWYTLRTGMVRLNDTSDFRITFMVKGFFVGRDLTASLPWTGEDPRERFKNLVGKRLSPIFGITLSHSLVESIIEKETVYLVGAAYEINRFIDVSAGWSFTDLTNENDQLWYGLSVDTDLFGFLATKVAGRD